MPLFGMSGGSHLGELVNLENWLTARRTTAGLQSGCLVKAKCASLVIRQLMEACARLLCCTSEICTYILYRRITLYDRFL